MKKNKDAVWTEEIAVAQHQKFFEMAITVFGVEKNFSISYLYLNFDKICSQLAYQNKSQK